MCDEDFSHWRIWKTINNLQAQKFDEPIPKKFSNEETSSINTHINQSYLQIVDNVVVILQLWGTAWLSTVTVTNEKANFSDNFLPGLMSTFTTPTEWAHLLNKKSLQHEVEESMVAIYYLEQWRQNSRPLERGSEDINETCLKSFVAVDVCGGKGIFSFLLQYYSILFWSDDKFPKLHSIILIEKLRRDDINWKHLNNLSALPEVDATNPYRYPMIQIWDDCNLFNYDSLVERFTNYKKQKPQEECKYAFTGIHLCKLLSPALISLVNLLGKDMCPYVCLVPCCLPRVVQSARIGRLKEIDNSKNVIKGSYSSKLQVFLHENEEQRQNRLSKIKLRDQARNRNSVCYKCQNKDHLLNQCSQFMSLTDTEQQQLVNDFVASRPCWECGEYGHYKAYCPIRTSNRDSSSSSSMNKDSQFINFLEPPIKEFDITNVFKEPDPIFAYCQLLSTGFDWWQMSTSTQIIQSGLNKSKGLDSVDSKNNWNKHRKSIYIIVV